MLGPIVRRSQHWKSVPNLRRGHFSSCAGYGAEEHRAVIRCYDPAEIEATLAGGLGVSCRNTWPVRDLCHGVSLQAPFRPAPLPPLRDAIGFA
jgi:hypothetical protein